MRFCSIYTRSVFINLKVHLCIFCIYNLWWHDIGTCLHDNSTIFWQLYLEIIIVFKTNRHDDIYYREWSQQHFGWGILVLLTEFDLVKCFIVTFQMVLGRSLCGSERICWHLVCVMVWIRNWITKTSTLPLY